MIACVFFPSIFCIKQNSKKLSAESREAWLGVVVCCHVIRRWWGASLIKVRHDCVVATHSHRYHMCVNWKWRSRSRFSSKLCRILVQFGRFPTMTKNFLSLSLSHWVGKIGKFSHTFSTLKVNRLSLTRLFWLRHTIFTLSPLRGRLGFTEKFIFSYYNKKSFQIVDFSWTSLFLLIFLLNFIFCYLSYTTLQPKQHK